MQEGMEDERRGEQAYLAKVKKGMNGAERARVEEELGLYRREMQRQLRQFADGQLNSGGRVLHGRAFEKHVFAAVCEKARRRTDVHED